MVWISAGTTVGIMQTTPDPELRWHTHLAPWNNDPVPFFHDGTYHLYLQHNPAAPSFGVMRWGHVSSPNLVDWTVHPEAISPGEIFDIAIWTGCVVAHDGRFYAFYTGIRGYNPLDQCQCMAVSDDLIHWEKSPLNPVVLRVPEGYGECFRDPCVFRFGDEWRMVIGSQFGELPVLLQYASADLFEWTYVGEAWRAPDGRFGFDAECPDLFPLEDKWVLLTSRFANHWQVGSFDGSRFVGETSGVCDGALVAGEGGFSAFYAGKTLLDGQGRRLLFGWATQVQGPDWKGAIATPRVVRLFEGGLRFEIPAELEDRFVLQPDGSRIATDGPLTEIIDANGHWWTSP